jgi:hypothetical protein
MKNFLVPNNISLEIWPPNEHDLLYPSWTCRDKRRFDLRIQINFHSLVRFITSWLYKNSRTDVVSKLFKSVVHNPSACLIFSRIKLRKPNIEVQQRMQHASAPRAYVWIIYVTQSSIDLSTTLLEHFTRLDQRKRFSVLHQALTLRLPPSQALRCQSCGLPN